MTIGSELALEKKHSCYRDKVNCAIVGCWKLSQSCLNLTSETFWFVAWCRIEQMQVLIRGLNTLVDNPAEFSRRCPRC